MKLLDFKILILSKIHKFKVYESLDFLPIWNYKQVEKTQDLRYLIKGVDYEHLPNAYQNIIPIWEKIYNDFIEQSNPTAITDLINQFVNYSNDTNKFNFIKLSIEVLSNKDFITKEAKDKLIFQIRSLGYRFDESSEDAYFNSLIDLEKQLVGLKRMIDFKNKELTDKYQDKPEPMDIEDILTMFTSVFPGTVFNSKTLTCKQYLSYLKRYNKIATEVNNKNKMQHGR